MTQLPEVPIQLCQPSISRRHLKDEEEPSECHIQPRLESDPQQAPLRSLRNLQPSARTLVIVLEVEALLIGGHQVVFEEYFENTNEVQMVTHLFDGIGHRLYLQGPLSALGDEQRTIYIAIVL